LSTSPSGPAQAAARTVLVGTTATLWALLRQLEWVEPRPALIGCVLPVGGEAEWGDGMGDRIPFLGDFNAIGHVLMAHQPVDRVLVSVPLAMRQQLNRIGVLLDQSGVIWRFMPTFEDQLAGRVRFPVAWPSQDGESAVGSGAHSVRSVSLNMGDAHSDDRSVAILPDGSPFGSIDTASLINRRPHPLDEPSIRRTLAGRCVLITGAGGSIGSDLARQVCRYQPSKLVLVERSENALFEIDRAIGCVFPGVARAAVLHDVAHPRSTRTLVEAHRPQVIFHAAAHKHVPMMEDHPAQAVENNFFGTRSIADAANLASVERFVMISTDKAVNPSSVMGATKRLAEMYIQHLNTYSDCTYCMVRFGNVLGSACSVLPIWTRQLAQGGPITVTHPDMHRYFMTIPEAAGLVLQSAALSRGGEVFVLNMGVPIRILDLARRFIACHGLRVDVDMPIEFTGVRPGEKLYEELAYGSEDLVPTPHGSVRVWQSSPPDPNRMEQVLRTFTGLRSKAGLDGHAWQGVSRETIVAALRVAVPEMIESAVG
jgi:FlaA1/EpsC-like NDP-sugar epimerase